MNCSEMFRKHSGPTPAYHMASQIITDCGNLPPDVKQHKFYASAARLCDLDFQIKCKLYFHLQAGLLDQLPNVQFFFSLAQLRRFWHVLCLRRGLTPGMRYLQHSSGWSLLVRWLQLQSADCGAPQNEWILLDNNLQAVVISIACVPFPATQFSTNVLEYVTLCPTSFFSNNLLWLPLL